MKVIFLQDVTYVARKNEVLDVKDGYARNFLIPNKLVKKATVKDLENLDVLTEANKEKNEQALETLKIIAGKMKGKEFVLKFKVGKEGQLFESVSSAKIAQVIKEEGFEVKEDQIVLGEPIKSVGEFPIEINFGNNLKTKVIVIITKLE